MRAYTLQTSTVMMSFLTSTVCPVDPADKRKHHSPPVCLISGPCGPPHSQIEFSILLYAVRGLGQDLGPERDDGQKEFDLTNSLPHDARPAVKDNVLFALDVKKG